MRLIDADLFKENIISGLYVFCQENKEDICDAIDCEPTIEPTLSIKDISDEDIERFKLIWKRATSKSVILVSQRPQGRWITEDELHCLYYCSECRSNGNRYQPFCGWCGAQMKGDS